MIKPKPGFDWTRVTWGGPYDRVTETCSYCGKTFPDDDADEENDYIPLRLWNDEGYACAFCDDCQRTWWGIA